MILLAVFELPQGEQGVLAIFYKDCEKVLREGDGTHAHVKTDIAVDTNHVSQIVGPSFGECDPASLN